MAFTSLRDLEQHIAAEAQLAEHQSHTSEVIGDTDQRHRRVPFALIRAKSLAKSSMLEAIELQHCACDCLRKAVSHCIGQGSPSQSRVNVLDRIETDRKVYFDECSEMKRARILWEHLHSLLRFEELEKDKVTKHFEFVVLGTKVCKLAWLAYYGYCTRTAERAMNVVMSCSEPAVAPCDKRSFHIGVRQMPQRVAAKVFLDNILQSIQHINPKDGKPHIPPLIMEDIHSKYLNFMFETEGIDQALEKRSLQQVWEDLLKERSVHVREKPDTKWVHYCIFFFNFIHLKPSMRNFAEISHTFFHIFLFSFFPHRQ